MELILPKLWPYLKVRQMTTLASKSFLSLYFFSLLPALYTSSLSYEKVINVNLLPVPELDGSHNCIVAQVIYELSPVTFDRTAQTSLYGW